MNNVKVNLNGDHISSNSNSNVNYHELNVNYNLSPEGDNSGDGINNIHAENEEEQEQEELSSAEIEHLKKIQEQTQLRMEKYANLYAENSPDSTNSTVIPKELDSDEKINNYNRTSFILFYLDIYFCFFFQYFHLFIKDFFIFR